MTQDTQTYADFSDRVGESLLQGKVAIVTGAGRGLGRCYALALAAAGAAVVVNDADEASAEEVASSITAEGGQALAVAARIGPLAVAQDLVHQAVSTFGRLDIMVTNAGILRDRVTWKMSEEDFDAVIETHLKGTWTCGRAAVEHMRSQGEGGRLILIGSPAGQFGSFGQSNYAPAKAGIVALGRTWSMELARDGITVNVVVPTAMTAMTATIPVYKEWAEAYEQGVALPQAARQDHALGGPEDVAPLIAWLASDDAQGVTGQAIGLGGDRLTLYSHPGELITADEPGGWSTAGIARAWSERFASHAQPSGMPPKPDPREHPAASESQNSQG
ncbi:SDR family NAD(P)-dependent oxidoreductase [Nesterenkonia flava]|uniref:SDR family NAD(P)-dependent oxidoreductase n=1 Tax=Nesterenkonia flava TaxID=469799 RepID=A0ABU1FPG6_9MICC|nr:SDR family NAD(P)-dependent oxidoreductase [Nesterenkonia flava]MDR5710536.1 SDR family NAD(P)-dependent oxidoreductase [Nesterenkonia flava]